MERPWLLPEVIRVDRDNPDHTGWDYPGLQQAAPLGTPAINDPEGIKRVFYRTYKLHTFPFRRLKTIPILDSFSFIRPAELHRDEGPQADLYKFISLLCFVNDGGTLRGKMKNIHVYTADNNEEIPLEASLGEILAGKYGKMDEDNPLRVVWIPGRKGRFYQPFPTISRFCGGKKKGIIYLPPSDIASTRIFQDPSLMDEEATPQDDLYDPPPIDELPHYDNEELPPSYEEIWE